MAASTRDTAPPVRIAKELRVERTGLGAARLYIDGELFPYATVEGFTVAPRRGEAPGVSLTIIGASVHVTDVLELPPSLG
jgi:hypothetical protein